MKRMLITAVVCSVCSSIYGMSPETVLSESRSYDWHKIATMSPLQSERESEESSTYAFNDKSKANFSLIESSALNGGAVSQYCMYDALIDLARKNTNGVRRAYYKQAVHFLIISACKGTYWQSEEALDFYLRESGTGLTRNAIDVNDCEEVIEKIVSYLAGA